jgi:hypothetical protein
LFNGGVPKGSVYVGSFIKEIQRIYQQSGGKTDVCSEYDEFILNAIADFLSNLVQDILDKISMQESGITMENIIFVFVVPTEWDLEIRKQLLRPLFIKANLISRTTTDNSRLLFYTYLESFVQLVQDPSNNTEYAIDGGRVDHDNQYLMCHLNWTHKWEITINLTLFEAKKPKTGLDGISSLIPRIVKNDLVPIDFTPIKHNFESTILVVLRKDIPYDKDGYLKNMLLECSEHYVSQKVIIYHLYN